MGAQDRAIHGTGNEWSQDELETDASRYELKCTYELCAFCCITQGAQLRALWGQRRRDRVGWREVQTVGGDIPTLTAESRCWMADANTTL